MKTINIKTSEETKELYALRNEFVKLEDKIGAWYEKYRGCKDDPKANDAVMGKYYAKASAAFKDADDFIYRLMVEVITENIYSEGNVL